MALNASLTAKPNISGAATLPVSDWTREEALEARLEEKPYALLDVPCEDIPKYVDLAQHTAPQSVIDRLETQQIRTAYGNMGYIVTHSGYIQALEDATGPRVNLDFFGVRVPESDLPGGMTAAEYYEHWRTNFDSYFDNEVVQFEFYPLEGEAARWNSDDPLGTLFSIQLMALNVDWVDDGTVAATDYNSSDWIFTTAWTPVDLEHPVSGNRQFGFERNGDGTVTFYTRGVDRITTPFYGLTNLITRLIKEDGVIFANAGEVWTNMTEHLKADLGSSAEIVNQQPSRPDYDNLHKFINREAGLAALECGM